MQSEVASPQGASLPLSGCRVIEHSRTVAAAYAGRLLAAMGAEVIMLEPAQGSVLRKAPPFLDGTGDSALFAYLSLGKRSMVFEMEGGGQRKALMQLLSSAHILIDDTPVAERASLGLDPGSVASVFPHLVHVSVLPFGAYGEKAHWRAEEINLLHAGGEGFLLPNGLANELFPDRPPLKIYGHFAGYQGGCMAAMSALAAWWAVPSAGGQFVDVSVQDAALAVGAFALQRLGDGSLEHRTSRRFRYGGVFQTLDGYLELLTLEDRQWRGLVQLMGNPQWALDPAYDDPLERSRQGDFINGHIREWMARHRVEDIVARAQELGVPAAKYRTPRDVVDGEHERARGLFARTQLDGGHDVDVLLAPFQFHCSPLRGQGCVPALGEMPQEDVL